MCLSLLGLGMVSGAVTRRRTLRGESPTHEVLTTPEGASLEAAKLLAAIRAQASAGRPAIDSRRKFLELFPRGWPAYRQQLALGQDLAAAGRPEEGIEYLREVSSRHRLTGRKHTLLATAAGIAASHDQSDTAIALYGKALAQPTLARSAARTAYRRALLLLEAGRRAAGLAGFKVALPGLSGRNASRARAHILILGGRMPSDIEGYAALARAHVTTGDRRGAEKVWDRAERQVRLQPGHLLGRAENLAALGETTDAGRIYNQIRTRNAGHPAAETALYRWARLMSHEHGAIRQARNAYEELLRRYPKGRHVVDAWLGLGDLEVKARNYNTAEGAYRRVLKLTRNPAKRWAASLSIGWCLIHRRKFGKAVQYFTQIKSQAGDPQQKQQLARGLKRARER